MTKDDKAKAGTFQFKMDIMSLANVFWKGDGVNTNDKNAYQTIGDTGKTYGNGFAQNKTYVNSMTPVAIKDKISAILGADMITIPADAVTSGYTGPNIFNRADAGSIQGVYASEYVANSGVLTFPKANTPKSWNANMTVTVSYQ
ncbi:hypothetical protein [Salmonella enterica]|uniref:F4 family fimbrial subunit n=1 Tax=Salmonella enterica TaxID=28901 RepID=UPI003F4AD8A7